MWTRVCMMCLCVSRFRTNNNNWVATFNERTCDTGLCSGLFAYICSVQSFHLFNLNQWMLVDARRTMIVSTDALTQLSCFQQNECNKMHVQRVKSINERITCSTLSSQSPEYWLEIKYRRNGCSNSVDSCISFDDCDWPSIVNHNFQWIEKWMID